MVLSAIFDNPSFGSSYKTAFMKAPQTTIDLKASLKNTFVIVTRQSLRLGDSLSKTQSEQTEHSLTVWHVHQTLKEPSD